MKTFDKKKLTTRLGSLGEISIEVLDTGEEKWLKEITDFVTMSEQRFIAIIMFKMELKNALYFQRVLQAFVDHIQMGGEHKQSNEIRKHFKNWVVSQNGSLQKIYLRNEQSINAAEQRQADRDSVQKEFVKRCSARG